MTGTAARGSALAAVIVVALGCSPSSAISTADVSTPTTASGATASASPAPTTPPSPPPSAAATGEESVAPPQPPVEFTGRIVCGPPVRGDREQTIDVGDEGMVVTRYRGGAWQQSVTMSDQRLEGTIHHTYESDMYSTAGAGAGPLVFAATWRIENEDGAWESRSIGATHSDGTSMGGDDSAEALIGEGAYEGLIAVMEVPPFETMTCGAAVDVRGIIFDSGLVPEPYIAASSR